MTEPCTTPRPAGSLGCPPLLESTPRRTGRATPSPCVQKCSPPRHIHTSIHTELKCLTARRSAGRSRKCSRPGRWPGAASTADLTRRFEPSPRRLAEIPTCSWPPCRCAAATFVRESRSGQNRSGQGGIRSAHLMVICASAVQVQADCWT